MKRAVTGATIILSIAWVLASAAACGGSDGGSSNEGAAAAAVAQYFIQERDGGRLPEGTDVRGVGIKANDVVELEARDEDEARGVSERFCMVYLYQIPSDNFRQHGRVYVAELMGGAWAISSVNPDGTCEGVE